MQDLERLTPEVVYSRLDEYPTLSMLLNETPTIVINPSTGERLEATPPAITRDELDTEVANLRYRVWGEAMVCGYVEKPRRILRSVA